MTALSKPRHAVAVEHRITTQQWHAFGEALSNDEPVKWVAAVEGQRLTWSRRIGRMGDGAASC